MEKRLTEQKLTKPEFKLEEFGYPTLLHLHLRRTTPRRTSPSSTNHHRRHLHLHLRRTTSKFTGTRRNQGISISDEPPSTTTSPAATEGLCLLRYLQMDGSRCDLLTCSTSCSCIDANL
ncbi:hypothetical protein Dimus_028542 [Dionaea muscipula]